MTRGWISRRGDPGGASPVEWRVPLRGASVLGRSTSLTVTLWSVVVLVTAAGQASAQSPPARPQASDPTSSIPLGGLARQLAPVGPIEWRRATRGTDLTKAPTVAAVAQAAGMAGSWSWGASVDGAPIGRRLGIPPMAGGGHA